MRKTKNTDNSTKIIRGNTVIHNIDPVFDSESKILILGSFPSVKSREAEFFYAHPRNRFWSVIAAVLECEKPETAQEKEAFLISNHIALWDVVYSCDICGSGDSSIRNVVPTDLKRIFKAAAIKAVYTNGSKAGELYRRYQERDTRMRAIVLPSTSPANAAWSPEKLCDAWQVIVSDRRQTDGTL